MIMFGIKWHRKRTMRSRTHHSINERPQAIDGAAVGEFSTGRKEQHSAQNASFFECFPYACPEPVLVK
jgi:hypothetical protein